MAKESLLREGDESVLVKPLEPEVDLLDISAADFSNPVIIKTCLTAFAKANATDLRSLNCGKVMLQSCIRLKSGEHISFRAFLYRAIQALSEGQWTRSDALSHLLQASGESPSPELNKEQIKQIIKDQCDKRGIVLPRSFNKDADTYIPDEVSNFGLLRVDLCRRINTLLGGDRVFREKYYYIHKFIAEEVRLKLLIRLGLEYYAQKPMKRTSYTPREILHLFLDSLPQGEVWNTGTLEVWSYDSEELGKFLLDNLVDNFTTIPVGTFEVLVGKDARHKLKRNPLVFKNKPTVRSIEDVSLYIQEFVGGLGKGEDWCHSDLLNWASEDGTNGTSLVVWMNRNAYDWSNRSVKNLLGEKADVLLRKHPYRSS